MTNKKALISWAFYDWGNSAFSAIIETFVFASFFVKFIADNPTVGTAEWGFANAAAAIIVAVLGPILGAIADNTGHRKIWLGIFTFLCVLVTAGLYFVGPFPSYVPLALTLVGLGIISSEMAFVFYNAMLPEIAPPDQIGRWSGFGWAMGYSGGMVCLLISLFLLFVDSSISSMYKIFFLTAGWYAIFSLPLFLFTPDKAEKKILANPILKGFTGLWKTMKNVRHYSIIMRFLIARMFYLDGLTTLFIFGGVYAAVVFDMSEFEILSFAIALNLSSGMGAFALAYLDDHIGSKNLIMISIGGLLLFTALILIAGNSILFWFFGLCLGIFVGPLQSASRAFLARLAPAHLRNEMFGFFALSGKATAFIGPALVSWIVLATGSQHLGLLVIIFFLLLGGMIMLTIPNGKIDPLQKFI